MNRSWFFKLLTSFITLFSHFFDEVSSGPQPILNGKLPSKGEFGYHVSVEMLDTNVCGGAIIDDLHIVTAAHCFLNGENEFFSYPIQIIAGTEQLYTECEHTVTVDVAQIFIPTGFDVRQNNKRNQAVGDIAVLKLRTELGVGKHKYLMKLDLPTEDANFDKKTAIVSGFGYNKDEQSNKLSDAACSGRDDKLYYLESTVMNIRQCEILKKKSLSNKHLCAAANQSGPNKPAGVCDGDSGGPLVYNKNLLIGIVSSGPKDCREDKSPSVYTKVWSYMDFIMNVREGRTDPNIRNVTVPSRIEWELRNM